MVDKFRRIVVTQTKFEPKTNDTHQVPEEMAMVNIKLKGIKKQIKSY